MTQFLPPTEGESRYNHLENMSVEALLQAINAEDQTVALAVARALPHLAALSKATAEKMKQGGRLFYIGAGTSGRLGIVDASELPPTYGLEFGRVVGLIAGGDAAIRKAVEFAEDQWDGAWNDLQEFQVNSSDVVVGIAASGTTPYVVGGLQRCRENNILTGCITCNPAGPIVNQADFPVVIETGPEFVTGSTRMKAGTAQKMALNMLSTTVMIQLGRIQGNRMVDMQIANEKLVLRGARMIAEALQCSQEHAAELLQKHGSVRKAIEHGK
jgi:N-acetylmuramic acid 6-phosphate etherase